MLVANFVLNSGTIFHLFLYCFNSIATIATNNEFMANLECTAHGRNYLNMLMLIVNITGRGGNVSAEIKVIIGQLLFCFKVTDRD